jgi:gliding motility-associated-like protein/uncharacterized repeat protein (TIGR01451 family)
LAGNDDSTVTKITQSPQVGIVKTSAYNQATGTITYMYAVSNTGNVTMYDITVIETATTFTGKGTLPVPAYVSGGSDLGGQAGVKDLLPGATMTLTATYKLVQADLDAGGVTNQALASGKDPKGTVVTDKSDKSSPVKGNDDPTVTAIQRNPAMSVTKTQDKPTYTKAGEVITYTIVVKNTGNVTLTGIKVTDPLTGFSQDITSLEPGKESVLTTKYTVKQSDIDGGTLVNKATVTSKDPTGKEIPGESSVTATAVRTPGLSVEKQSNLMGANAEMLQGITYTIRVTNSGNTTLTGVTLTDPLTGLNVSVGTILPGEVRAYTTSYIVKVSDESAGKVENTASAQGSVPGGGNVNGSATVTDKVTKCEVIIPEIFSPNGDGNQDYFRVKCIEKYPNASIVVFNRWGNKVYEKANYGNATIWGPTDGWWDGKCNTKWKLGGEDELLPAATYFYILNLNDGSGKRHQGYVFLNTNKLN